MYLLVIANVCNLVTPFYSCYVLSQIFKNMHYLTIYLPVEVMGNVCFRFTVLGYSFA